MSSASENSSSRTLAVRYDREAARSALEGNARSRRILSVSGIVAALLLSAIALVFLDGWIIVIVILLALANVFMTSVHLPAMLRRSAEEVAEVHTEDGFVMMLAPDGFHRPAPGGSEHYRWDEVELSAQRGSESNEVIALQIALPGESYRLRTTFLDPRPEQILERAEELRRLS